MTAEEVAKMVAERTQKSQNMEPAIPAGGVPAALWTQEQIEELKKKLADPRTAATNAAMRAARHEAELVERWGEERARDVLAMERRAREAMAAGPVVVYEELTEEEKRAAAGSIVGSDEADAAAQAKWDEENK